MEETCSTATVTTPEAETTKVQEVTAVLDAPSVVKILPNFIPEVAQLQNGLNQARSQLADITLTRHRIIRGNGLTFSYGKFDVDEANLCRQIEDMQGVMIQRTTEIATAHGLDVVTKDWRVNMQTMCFELVQKS